MADNVNPLKHLSEDELVALACQQAADAMTLRDHFAGQIVAAHHLNLEFPFKDGSPESVKNAETVATSAYFIADAMLKARAK